MLRLLDPTKKCAILSVNALSCFLYALIRFQTGSFSNQYRINVARNLAGQAGPTGPQN